MSRARTVAGLVAAVLLQVAVLVGMQVGAALPLWTGETVRVATVPVDPRSLFRGNYAILRYDTDAAAETLSPDWDALRHGEVVYLSLVPGGEGLHVWTDAALAPPETGLFVRGRIDHQRSRGADEPPGITLPNIEAFFAPKATALRLERELRAGGVAVISVTANGAAALRDVETRLTR
ncbi:MAG: GDYXXLXY domain-containing protein [Pseudomonadota bacterium]